MAARIFIDEDDNFGETHGFQKIIENFPVISGKNVVICQVYFFHKKIQK